MDETTKQLVNELRRRLGSHLDHSYDWDYNFIRWLTAYDNDIEYLLPILMSALEFRRALKLDKVTDSDVSFRDTFSKPMQEYYPGGICGYDKRGNVVVIEPTGRCDPRGLLPMGRCSEFVKWRLFETEHVQQLIRANEKKLNKKCGLTMVMDLEGLTMDQIYMPTMHIYTTIITIVQRNYPDMLCKLLIIKAPAVMNVAYRIVLPFLNKKTRDKLEIVTGDAWRARLLDLIEPSQIPVYWGGTMTGHFGDYGNVRMGGKIPEDLKHQPHYTKSADELTSVTVGRGSISKVPFQIDKPDSQIHWYVSCAVGDIEFGINKVEPENRPKVILPHFRLNTEHVAEYGSMSSLELGQYELIFDNSYSWIRGKTVLYSLDIKQV